MTTGSKTAPHGLLSPLFATICIAVVLAAAPVTPANVHLRVNQVGYLPKDAKVAVVFADKAIDGSVSLVVADSHRIVFTGTAKPVKAPGWGRFTNVAHFDFSTVEAPGSYRLRHNATGELSARFSIGVDAYSDFTEELLRFMRQQRCGHNPVLGRSCHQKDGRTAYGPMPNGTFVDARGGWHDAGDQLKYLLTGSNATARMLLAYDLEPEVFDDRVDGRGDPVPNGVPDVLDEARWGLEWIFKLHPKTDQLFHQVADDRDHIGWKLPGNDPSDYGWGPNSARVLYFATGDPQGLGEHSSEATGLANIAGRSAAAMAMAHRIWAESLGDSDFAARCLKAAKSLYNLGKANEGYQQGNSYGSPYRYTESTWADDMEWAAAELYRITKSPEYLNDAIRYAKLAADTSWMPHETTRHYEYYPFVNVGHFALHPHVDAPTQARLASYYRSGIEATVKRARSNPFRIGVPFIWCSNNLVTGLITQIILYERITGDLRYHKQLLAQRDWLFGRNPWGTSMFTGIPRRGEHPEDVHTSVWKLTRRAIAGGLVDGPVTRKVFDKLKGLHLVDTDEFAPFQSKTVVYHDDIGDYSTNEPTMDGTAGAVLMLAHLSAAPDQVKALAAKRIPKPLPEWEVDAGGIRRGSRKRKEIALIFTGGAHVEGAAPILETLNTRGVCASFFLTGEAIAVPGMREWIRTAIAAGHSVGPHSHGHLLYAPWDKRKKSLVTKEQFQADLFRNLAELRDLGAALAPPIDFVPPYEWHNTHHTAWAAELGLRIINFTSGSGSHRDFAPEDHGAFRSSKQLIEEILEFESSADHGLNGHLLLFHLGSTRRDKVHPHLGGLIDELTQRGYVFQCVDRVLRHTDETSESASVSPG